MSESNEERRQQAWSAYWSSGRLHSCAADAQDNYSGAISTFWRELFSRLPAGNRILDLATGNGPLPHLLWELRRGDVEVDAVDMARVAPAWYQAGRHHGVRFSAGVRMEALPFRDGSFDLVVSQFGIEYSDRSRALAESVRVARPGGAFAFVLHHAGSVLVRVGRQELAHHDWLLAEEGLIQAARAVVPWIASIRAAKDIGDPLAATAARERYNRAMQALAVSAEVSAAPDLLLEARERVHRLLAAIDGSNTAPILDGLDGYAKELEGARLRMAEMVERALTRDGLDEFAAQLLAARPGISIRCDELRQPEGLLAWSITASGG